MIAELERVSGRPVSRETSDKLEAYVERLKAESARQNLVSASTLERLWERHILDSAQLVRFEPRPRASWLDVGSGAGLPGIVIACLVDGPVTLVEPRRRAPSSFATRFVCSISTRRSNARRPSESRAVSA
jgi:16S rRNA (guanine527-N7)-methyltransferase